MGYANYTLPDGREAGYGVDAECDASGCSEQINRGMGYLCGEDPDGWRDEDKPGCGKYFCEPHLHGEHACPKPECGKYSTDGNSYCGHIAGHAGRHRDPNDDTEFSETEDDEE